MAVIANPVKGTKKQGSVGMPLPDVEVRILDAEDGTTRLAAGETGEIVIKAPQLMQGYWQKPDETREMIRVSADGERLLFTGDLGYLDDDGYLFIVDRKKDMIKTSGYQVWPREIEEVISAHPAVHEVGVAGIPDKMRGEKAKAWVVLNPGATLTEAELKSWCRERLAQYKIPAKFEFVNELPKTQVGKVLRRALREKEPVAERQIVFLSLTRSIAMDSRCSRQFRNSLSRKSRLFHSMSWLRSSAITMRSLDGVQQSSLRRFSRRQRSFV
jgi:long-chain acyl-CoA synthetase